jgi:hypothetical protein
MIHNAIVYLSGGFTYSVHKDFILTYALTQVRFIFFSFLLVTYFVQPYTVLTLVLAVVLADFRFFLDYNTYIEAVLGQDEDNEDF